MGEEGEGDYIPTATLFHQNDSYIKMGSDESHFNVSFTSNSEGQSHPFRITCDMSAILCSRAENSGAL